MTTNYLKRDAILIFFAGLMIFTLGLRNQEIVGFESRFYLFALEMWRHGVSFFPTTYGVPYPDYPATSTFLIYLAAKMFGGLNKMVAVFPSAMAAGLTLSATYLIGARQSRRWGWVSVGFLLFTLAFLTEARTISLDMFVTMVTTFIFYFIYSASIQGKNIPWLKIILLLIAGFAIRGPIGFIIPASVASIFYLLQKEWKTWIFLNLISAALLLICVGILMLMAFHTGGLHFMQEVLQMQGAGRMAVNQTPPFYFYFIENIGACAVTYPLCLLVLMGVLPQLFKKNVSREIQLLRLCAAWVLIILAGLSIPADKKIRYVLAISPALALMASSLFILTDNRWLDFIKKCFLGICRILPLLGLGVLFWLHHKNIDLSYVFLGSLFGILQIAMFAYRNPDTHFVLAVMTFFLAHVFIVEHLDLQANQTREFVRHVEYQRHQAGAMLAFYREGRDGLAIKYLINMPEEENPLFVTDMENGFLIASKENFDALPKKLRSRVHVIAVGKIGHDDVVVFSINKRVVRPGGAS